ncbi:MAG TPA: DUF3341 domain-containing protein [Candidatus Didemnitutus sp.]|nr:DUF3341 domain-containing protein [Candidatus Didemnitutus sp.]
MKTGRYGIAVTFDSVDRFRSAWEKLRELGFTRCEIYTPHSVGEDEDGTRTGIPAIMVGAGGLGALGGFLLQVYATWDFPSNSGGRPVFSWPAYIPITFELGVLTAVLVGILAFLWRAGLPNYHHPAFNDPVLRRAAFDRYIICIRNDDPVLQRAGSRGALDALGAAGVEEIAR